MGLTGLVGKEVKYYSDIEDENGDDVVFDCIITGYELDDWHFYEKNECMSFTVSLKPVKDFTLDDIIKFNYNDIYDFHAENFITVDLGSIRNW